MPQIESNIGVSLEVTPSARADALIHIEHLSLSRSDMKIQDDWLDRAEEALRKLRPQVEAALLDYAEAELKVVRADPSSPQKWKVLKARIL